MMMNEKPLIFLSHAAVDQEIAMALKRHLTSALPGAEVFVSSDPDDLPLGDPWVASILAALSDAKIVLALASERGLSRRWVWFESGRAWFSKIPCIPCCLGKMRKTALPAPFSSLMGMNLDEAGDLTALVAKCSTHLGLPITPLLWAQVADELIRLDIRAEERQKGLDDPFSSELTKEVERAMKVLGSAEKEGIRVLLKYGELSDKVAAHKVWQSGKSTGMISSILASLEQQTGWIVRTKMSPFPQASREEDCFEISPRMRPYLMAWFERNH